MADTAENERDENEHFTGQGNCKIHTSRSHNSCTVGAKSGCNHQTNCDTSQTLRGSTGAWVWGDLWESHHLLCVSSVNAYQVLKAYDDGGVRSTIDAIYRATEWCINQQPNLIALPMKAVYFDSSSAVERQNALPCHNWDHNCTAGYTDEVIMKLHLEVWQKLKEVKEADKCKAAEGLKAQLPQLSDHFRAELRRRATRIPGGIQTAYEEASKKTEERGLLWWFPFSMANDSVAALRPAFGQGSDARSRWQSATTRLDLKEQGWAVVRQRS